MRIIRKARKVLGALLYVFMALPLTLGGLTLMSVRQWAADPEAYVSLVKDERFTALIQAPELAERAPASIELLDMTLEGPAALAAFQAGIPARTVVSTAEGAIRSFFDALDRGSGSFSVDLSALKADALKGRSALVAAYFEKAASPATLIPAGLLPAGIEPAALSKGALEDAAARVVRERLEGLPDAIPVNFDPVVLGETERSMPRSVITPNLTALQAAIAGASIWLLVAGGALCVASAFLAEEDWRRRVGSLGSHIMGPGIFVLVIGLLPHLINPAAMMKNADIQGFIVHQIPALGEYLKFLAGRLTGGFLVSGLVAVGLGTAFSTARYVLPARDDEEEETDLA